MSKHTKQFKKAALAALSAVALSLSFSTGSQAQTLGSASTAASNNPNASMVDDRITTRNAAKPKKIFMRKPGAIAKAKTTALKPSTSAARNANKAVDNFVRRPGATDALKNAQKAQNQRAQFKMKAFSKNTQQVLNGKTSAAQKARAKGNAAKQIRNNAKMRQMFNQKLANGQKGILKRVNGTTKVKKGILKQAGSATKAKNVRFNLKPIGKGAKYGPKTLKGRVIGKPGTSATKLVKHGKTARTAKNARKINKTAKTARNLNKSRNAAKIAANARKVRNGVKAAKMARTAGRAAMVSTGVGAVVVGAGMLAGAAGVDPADLALLKATDPAAYNRKMRALKKNPVKYMGNNLKNNTAKAARNVGNATKKAGQAVGKATKTAANKVGCGVGNIFKKKKSRKKC